MTADERRIHLAERYVERILKAHRRTRSQILRTCEAATPAGLTRSDWNYAVRAALERMTASGRVTLLEEPAPPVKMYALQDHPADYQGTAPAQPRQTRRRSSE